jgi:hypothetical protein
MDILEKELIYTISENKKAFDRTDNAKKNFISELKNGLGEDLKNNYNKITIIKKPFLKKLTEGLIKFFTKF